MNIFIAGQVNRMLPLFDTPNGIRRDILTNAACLTGLSCTNNFMNQTVTFNKTVTSCGDINVRNVTVNSGKLTLKAAGKVNMTSGFEVQPGAELETIKIQ
jgi:Cu/Ag efflux protein CusF